MDIFNDKPIINKKPKIKAGKTKQEEHDEVRKQFNWTSELIDKYDEDLKSGYINDLPSPYLNGIIGLRKPNLNFQFSEDELEEYKKCKRDISYFANSHCYAMTDEGIRNITLRNYQNDILTTYQKNRFVILLSGRQIGKCVSPTTTVQTPRGIKYMFELYYEALKERRIKLNILDKLKYNLYRLMAFCEKKHVQI